MKKVVFRVDANATIGYGHFYRCLSLAQMLSEDFCIVFVMASPPLFIKSALYDLSFELLEQPELAYKTPDEKSPEEEVSFDLCGLLEGVHVLVLDGYWFGPKYQQALRVYDLKVVIVEDDGRGHYFADLIVNHAPGLNGADYSSDGELRLALGTEYSLLRPHFLEQAKLPVTRSRSLGKVMVCFGGADFCGLAQKVTQWLLDHTQLAIHLISGSVSFEDIHAPSLDDRLVLNRGLNELEMKQAMLDADFGIVPSSGILYECMACRLPVISGMFTENQARIYHGLKDEGVFLDSVDFNLNRMAELLGSLTPEVMDGLVENQIRLVDGYADKRFKNLFACLS